MTHVYELRSIQSQRWHKAESALGRAYCDWKVATMVCPVWELFVFTSFIACCRAMKVNYKNNLFWIWLYYSLQMIQMVQMAELQVSKWQSKRLKMVP